jgi:hypothetical protein
VVLVARLDLMASLARKLLVVAVPAAVLSIVLGMLLVETWVRWSWDDKKGTPGFYVSDPARGQRLVPGYDGWFAGVPTRINRLGFRDDREYSVDKTPGTFRILVLGDSVTFGHGSLYEHTYPRLLEERLRQWRPTVQWEVWNLGVPGYNTSQELAYLQEVGPQFHPDLVIVGFYPNDFTANVLVRPPSLARRAVSAAQRAVQQHLYSYEFYKRIVLSVGWRLAGDSAFRGRLEQLEGEETLLKNTGAVANLAEQQLTPVEHFDDGLMHVCAGPRSAPNPYADRLRTQVESGGPEIAAWLEAVHSLQRLNRDGTYRLMFFVNMAPPVCDTEDRFYYGGAEDDDRLLRETLGADGTPVASSTVAFLNYRPTQMPIAGGHSIGNSNRVKADVLFDFLKDSILPPLIERQPN